MITKESPLQKQYKKDQKQKVIMPDDQEQSH
jgi:hypothetical protein